MADTSEGIDVYRGSTEPMIWRFKNADDSLFDLTGSRLILTIAAHGAIILRKDTETDAEAVIDIGEAKLTVTPTTTETRLIPMGRLAIYELERWVSGTQKRTVRGYVNGIGDINND